MCRNVRSSAPPRYGRKAFRNYPKGSSMSVRTGRQTARRPGRGPGLSPQQRRRASLPQMGAWPAPRLFHAATRIPYQAEVEPWHFCLTSINVGQSELPHDQIGVRAETNSSRKRDGCPARPSEEKKITGRKSHENCLSRHGYNPCCPKPCGWCLGRAHHIFLTRG
jgi:hypothetical protein